LPVLPVCLPLFTLGVIRDQEPQEFNEFLTKIYERLKEGDAAKFFQLLSSKNISLISKEEAPDRFAKLSPCVHTHCG
jgi:ATP-dependent DNA helicase 2 subunit 2